MNAINTGKQTNDGLVVYDLDPQSSELWAVAGPDGIDPKTIDTDDLPDGFRWVESDEWETLQRDNPPLLLHGQPVHRIHVWWDTDSGRDSEGWAIHVYGPDNSEIKSQGIDADPEQSLDEVIDRGLWEVGIEGINHDDFAKSKKDGGYAEWEPSDE